MKLYFEILKALSKKYILKKNTGIVIKDACENMGIVYIKLAQILSTQNVGNVFTEEDRRYLSSICDNCKPISFDKIKSIIESEYNKSLDEIFSSIEEQPVGSASISQVHRATLKDGKVVAIKIKRKDITKSIESDINRIRKLMNRYGKLFGFKNIIGGNKALDLYLQWIYEETDFKHEKENIKKYKRFGDSVNGSVKDTKEIKVPMVYDELCTDNIIVMDYVDSKTINQMELNESNKQKIGKALNSYLQLSFNALFNDKKIIFHGDPHGGNIYIDDDDNIGFLDMGLLFELSEEDSKMTREFFLAAFLGNHKKIYELLMPYGKLGTTNKEDFKKEISIYCDKIKNMPVTSYFMEMVNICLKYEISPPDFLFCMTKAFVCLDGISGFSENITKATELLKKQVTEFYVKRTIEDTYNLTIEGLSLAPRLIQSTLKYGLVRGLVEEIPAIEKVQLNLKESLDNYREILDFFIPSNCDNPFQNVKRDK